MAELKWTDEMGVEQSLRRCQAYGSYTFYVATPADIIAALAADPDARAEVLTALSPVDGLVQRAVQAVADCAKATAEREAARNETAAAEERARHVLREAGAL